MTWNVLLAQQSGIINNLPQLVSTASVSPRSHWTEETLTRDVLTTTVERLVLPVWWCSSHMAEVIPGNWTLWSTLISDAPAPQTPCRHLNIVSVKIKITLTCQLKPGLWSHSSAGAERTLPSVLAGLRFQPWHSGDASHPKCCERWAHKFH